jgi:diaminopimelate epimerase
VGSKVVGSKVVGSKAVGSNPMMLVKTHGSLNEIFALDATPDEWESDAALREFVRRVCGRSSWTGGSDGIYLYDASERDAQAWFFNPDGSSAEFCGNGMRGLGRLILDLRGTDTEVIGSGGRDYTVHRAPSTPEGVRQVLLELPPLRFDDAPLPEPFGGFTAVAVPNPHVIAMVERYCEPDLIELGKRADEVFAAGANVSFLQPLPGKQPHDGDAPEVFVRTFERGAGLTPSCGSGVVASRAAYSRVTGLDPGQRVVVRNAGGVAAATIRVRDGAWYPLLEGNATVVYRVAVTLDGSQAGPVEWAADENAGYLMLDERNTAYLKSHGIATIHP